jgi:hypothetical protein
VAVKSCELEEFVEAKENREKRETRDEREDRLLAASNAPSKLSMAFNRCIAGAPTYSFVDSFERIASLGLQKYS